MESATHSPVMVTRHLGCGACHPFTNCGDETFPSYLQRRRSADKWKKDHSSNELQCLFLLSPLFKECTFYSTRLGELLTYNLEYVDPSMAAWIHVAEWEKCTIENGRLPTSTFSRPHRN